MFLLKKVARGATGVTSVGSVTSSPSAEDAEQTVSSTLTGAPSIPSADALPIESEAVCEVLNKMGPEMRKQRFEEAKKKLAARPFKGVTMVDEINVGSKPWERDDWDLESQLPIPSAAAAAMRAGSASGTKFLNRKSTMLSSAGEGTSMPFPGVRHHHVARVTLSPSPPPFPEEDATEEGLISPREGFLKARERLSAVSRTVTKPIILGSELAKVKAMEEDVERIQKLFQDVDLSTLSCGHFAWDVDKTVLDEVIVEGEKTIILSSLQAVGLSKSPSTESFTPWETGKLNTDEEEDQDQQDTKKSNRRITFSRFGGSRIRFQPVSNGTVAVTDSVKMRSNTSWTENKVSLQRSPSPGGSSTSEEVLVTPPTAQALQTLVGYLFALQGLYEEALFFLCKSLFFEFNSSEGGINLVALADLLWVMRQEKDLEKRKQLYKILASYVLVRISVTNLAAAMKRFSEAPSRSQYLKLKENKQEPELEVTEGPLANTHFLGFVELGVAATFAYRFEEGTFWLKKALELRSEDPTCLALLCKCLIGMDRIYEAVEVGNRLKKGSPDDSHAFAFAAYIKALGGQKKDFYQLIERLRNFSCEKHWQLFVMYAADYVVLQQGFRPGRCSVCASSRTVSSGYYVNYSNDTVLCKKCYTDQSSRNPSTDYQFFDARAEKDFFEAHLDMRRQEILGPKSKVPQYMNRIAMVYLSHDIEEVHSIIDQLQHDLQLNSAKRKGFFRCLGELSLVCCVKDDPNMATAFFLNAASKHGPYFGRSRIASLFVELVSKALVKNGLSTLPHVQDVYSLAVENLQQLVQTISNPTIVQKLSYHPNDIKYLRESLFQMRIRVAILAKVLNKLREAVTMIEEAYCDMAAPSGNCLSFEETMVICDALLNYVNLEEEKKATNDIIANHVLDWGVMVESEGGKAKARREIASTLLLTQQVLHPNHERLLQRVALCHMALEEWIEACATFTLLKRLRPTTAREESYWGDCHLYLGEYPEALDHYKRAFAKEPRTASYWANAALVSLLLDDMDSTLYGAHRACRLEPNHPDAPFWRQIIETAEVLSRDPEPHDIREDRVKQASLLLLEASNGVDHDVIGKAITQLKASENYSKDPRAKRVEMILQSMLEDTFWVMRDITINIWDRQELLVCIRHTHRTAVMQLELCSGKMRRQEGSSFSEKDLKRLTSWFK